MWKSDSHISSWWVTIVRAIVNTRCEPLSTGNQHPQTDYLRKRLTILLHTNRPRYEPGREEHNVCDSVWPTKSSTWTLFLIRTTNAQISLNTILISERTTALTTPTPLQPLYLTYEGRTSESAYYLQHSELHTNPCSLYDAYSLMLRAKTNLKTDCEQFIRSDAPTARPLKSARPPKT